VVSIATNNFPLPIFVYACPTHRLYCADEMTREHEAEIARHRFAERRTDSGRALLLKATQSRPDRTPVRHD